MCQILNIHTSGKIGNIVKHGTDSVLPPGTVWCDGTSYSTTGTYAALFAVCGYSHGGSGANFNVPDLRGRFLRGNDPTGAHDPNYNTRSTMNTGGNAAGIGSVQAQATATNGLSITDGTTAINNTFAPVSNTTGAILWGEGATNNNSVGLNCTGEPVTVTGGVTQVNISAAIADPTHSHNITGTPAVTGSLTLAGGNETRSLNAYLSFIICYK